MGFFNRDFFQTSGFGESERNFATLSCNLFSGKSNPYCEVTMGSQCHITKTLQDTLNPKWNSNCQFFIKDLEQDVLCVTVFERDQFSPDGEAAGAHTHTHTRITLCLKRLLGDYAHTQAHTHTNSLLLTRGLFDSVCCHAIYSITV